MKKYIIAIVLGLLMTTGTVYATGEWSDWWGLNDYGGRIKKIYDHENKLVCWVYQGHNAGGIDCEPSLELNHPLVK